MGIERKILVEVTLPSSGTAFDVFVYPLSPVSEVINLLVGAIQDFSWGYYQGDETSLLCFKENGVPLDINRTIVENGLKNGSKLILI
ncbi:hypothetical protein [Acetobacterium sp.]|uniref:hypothetical protein n=1 Tax=Acetobacterium sp. TaxID=1872094 RepID=UPI0035935F51